VITKNSYLVIDNIPYKTANDKYLKVVEIGYINNDTCRFLYKIENVKGIRFDIICSLSKNDKNLVYMAFENSKEQLERIKQKTGIDLLNNEKYLK
jgi:hypothetical protein